MLYNTTIWFVLDTFFERFLSLENMQVQNDLWSTNPSKVDDVMGLCSLVFNVSFKKIVLCLPFHLVCHLELKLSLSRWIRICILLFLKRLLTDKIQIFFLVLRFPRCIACDRSFMLRAGYGILGRSCSLCHPLTFRPSPATGKPSKLVKTGQLGPHLLRLIVFSQWEILTPITPSIINRKAYIEPEPASRAGGYVWTHKW